MGVHIVKLKDHQEVAEGTISFFFEKPADFEFAPRLSIDLTLLKPPETDADGNSHRGSMLHACPTRRIALSSSNSRKTFRHCRGCFRTALSPGCA